LVIINIASTPLKLRCRKAAIDEEQLSSIQKQEDKNLNDKI